MNNVAYLLLCATSWFGCAILMPETPEHRYFKWTALGFVMSALVVATNVEAQTVVWQWDAASTSSASTPFVSPPLGTGQSFYNGKLKYIAKGADGGNQQSGWEFQSYTLGSLTSGKELVYQFDMELAPGFKFGNATQKWKASRMKHTDEVHTPFWTGYICSTGFYLGECPGCSPGGQDPSRAYVYHDLTKDIGTGSHHYEIRIKTQSGVSTCDGSFTVYRDGSKLGSVSAMCYVDHNLSGTEAWSGWMVAPYFQLNGTSTDGGTIYVDNITNSVGGSSPIPEPGPIPTPVPIPVPSCEADLVKCKTVIKTCKSKPTLKQVRGCFTSEGY